MRQLAISTITDGTKSQWCAASVIETPKDLSDFHKAFLASAKSFGAKVVEQDLLSCVAKSEQITFSYKVGRESLPDQGPWEHEHWAQYKKVKRKPTKKTH